MGLTALSTPPLVAAVDSAEFGEVYRDQLRSVWRMLRRLGLDEAVVDDAVQDVFVTAYRRWNDFEGRSTRRTWLLGIALRVARDHRRRRRATEPMSPELPALGPGPDERVDAQQRLAHVKRVLSQLPAEQEELLVLVDLEGYSVPEVAEAAGLNQNTVYTRLRAARARFEALLGGTR